MSNNNLWESSLSKYCRVSFDDYLIKKKSILCKIWYYFMMELFIIIKLLD